MKLELHVASRINQFPIRRLTHFKCVLDKTLVPSNTLTLSIRRDKLKTEWILKGQGQLRQ